MSTTAKPPYNLALRLQACWRILIGRTWACYVPDGPQGYCMAWQGMRMADLHGLRQWANDREKETLAAEHLLDSILNLNPGIAPAPEQ